ncbi:MAG: FAD-dependent oxidoreductase [Candidatus Subteraquimicrobiales bacterium]|nr:FAD-dependent oxidoreductase [Candidatus Subteraquimicrobiales bacterium]
MLKYDVVIVGAGPAGIFAAYELTHKKKLSVLILEKGNDIDKRTRGGSDINVGWGGAGAFSDGKLNLSTEVGGWLNQCISEDALEKLIDYVDGLYIKFGSPNEISGSTNNIIVARLKRQAALADLTLIPTRIRHLGTENCYRVLKNIREYFTGKVDVRVNTVAERILVEDGKAVGVETSEGERISAQFVIVAPGREGAEWLTNEARRLGLSLTANAVDVGLRLELPAPVLEPLTDYLYEPKLIYYSKSFDDKVRTFCVCPYGEVSVETYGEVLVVNGHSYKGRKTENTNFSLLVSTSFTEPFHEPIAYGKYIARLANLLGEGIIIQRLGDLQKGRRSTDERIKRGAVKPTLPQATPGDLSFVLPYRYLSDILEMIQVIDKLTPGVNAPDTLLYGIEVKFYSSRLKLKSSLESEVDNLYAIGDGAGITRGLVQASVSGTIAARDILERVKKD